MVYSLEDRKQILKGQCLNNAATLMSGWTKQEVVSAATIFDYAEALYKEANDRNWLDTKEASVPVKPIVPDIQI